MSDSRIRTAIVGISDISPNAWNPNVMSESMYRKELASIRKFGYVNPILVRERNGGYEVIDGEHRLRAVRQLGYTEIEATIIEGLDDEEAKQLTIVLNETRGQPDRAKLGGLLQDLLQAVPKADLLDLLPIAPVDFDRLTGMEAFDWGSLGKPEGDMGAAGARWVERTYRLPTDSAAVIDEAIAAAKDDDQELQDWQALELIAADFLAGTGATQSRQLTAHASIAGKR